VTFEGDGHPPEVALLTLRRLRKLVPRASRVAWEAMESPQVSSGFSNTAMVSRAWDLFEKAYAGRGVLDDVEGEAAERDFRLAVLAQELDRTWPLTRLLLAGTREALSTFAASTEFRGVFEKDGETLPKAFFSYARRLLREAPDPGVEAVVSFEAWSATVAEGARRNFPVDLSEVVFAARTMRRHLAARAWASGTLELSSLEALKQVAHRAPRRPWEPPSTLPPSATRR
jgi:uncharacterized protein